MVSKPRSGFTLIELLVVIAIIAILAALLFPVFNRVKVGTRQTTCMSHMHAIYVAASQYKMDEGDFPIMLLGPAEQVNGLPWAQGDPQPPVRAEDMKHAFLYKKYIKDIDTFHCPENVKNDQTLAVTASYPTSSPWNAILPGGLPTIADFGFKGFAPAIMTRPLYMYAYDSYDATSYLAADGTTNGTYSIAYSRDWSANVPLNIPGPQDAPNQLKYQSPPNDKTIITICNRHVTQARLEQCPVLFASGTTRLVPYKKIFQSGWQVGN
jgi:prepilin-type N-terminal cleavage/methylation domain-containing protein